MIVIRFLSGEEQILMMKKPIMRLSASRNLLIECLSNIGAVKILRTNSTLKLSRKNLKKKAKNLTIIFEKLKNIFMC